MRNHLQWWRRAGREKQSQFKRASVEGGYLPENETESIFVFLVSLRLKGCRSRAEESESSEFKMIRGVLSQVYLQYVFISQKRLQHEKYRMSHDIGDSSFFILFLRLSGILNCWLSPMNMSQKHFKGLTNSSSPLTFDKDIFGCP